MGQHQEVHALRGVNLTIQAGEYIALKGRSGSGKTTLLNCIGGLDRPTSGAVRIYGEDPTALSGAKLVQWRRSQIGFVFQSFGLLPTLSAYENVELVLRMARKPLKECRERTRFCLDLVDLTKWSHHRPYEMSGGQQQRVAIARALANQPRLILADEPTGELDSATSREILTLFRKIAVEEQITLLIASHDQLIGEYASHIVNMSDGSII